MGGIFILIFLAAQFLATCLVEAAIVAGMAPRGRVWLLVEISLALNLLTWPLATKLVSSEHFSLLAIELGLIAIEAAGYVVVGGLPRTRALLLAIAANAASLLGGLALYWVWLARLSA